MDSVLAIGSSLAPRQVRPAAARDPELGAFIATVSAAEPNTPAGPASVTTEDAADDRQRMLHFISHVDAACFISLLQTMDPMPADSRLQAEYKRHYRQLREALEVPLPPQDQPPAGFATE